MSRRKISDEERALLAHAMRDVSPLAPPPAAPDEGPAAAPALRNPPVPKPPPKAAHGPAKPKPKKVSPPVQAPLDAKTRQKLIRGQIEIDAKLDLHGLRQDEAHQRLVHFIDTCVRRGLRTVLVITGKGQARPDAESAGFVMPEARGVLKVNVPRWLAEPGLRAQVWSVSEAGPRHGGGGAFYVMLRRRRKNGDAA